MDISFLTQRPPRHYEIIAGVVSLLAGILLLLVSLFAYYRLSQRGFNQNAALITCIVTLMGVMFTSGGIRLLLSHRRPNGGLLGPLVLFLGGLFFFCSPFYIYLHQPLPMIGLAFNFVAGVTCFVVCWRRVRQNRKLGT